MFIQTNTFQAVLVTNKTLSYYAFSYACGDMEWSGQGHETAIIGYSSYPDYVLNHPANGHSDISQVVSCSQQTTPEGERSKRQSTGGEPGIGPVPGDSEVMRAAEICNALATVDRVSIPNADDLRDQEGRHIFDVLPPCPPTRGQVVMNSLFGPFFDETRNCYQSTVTFEPFFAILLRPYSFVSVCCYDAISG